MYTDYEFAIIKREVALFREAGSEGVVIGCLDAGGALNMEQMRELMAEAGGMKVTLHRAFDVCADPIETYRLAGELGIDTILTSGQKKECLMGLPLLKQLGEMQKAGMPRVMAGAGVMPDVIRQFCEQTNITSYHLSAKRCCAAECSIGKRMCPWGFLLWTSTVFFKRTVKLWRRRKKCCWSMKKRKKPNPINSRKMKLSDSVIRIICR